MISRASGQAMRLSRQYRRTPPGVANRLKIRLVAEAEGPAYYRCPAAAMLRRTGYWERCSVWAVWRCGAAVQRHIPQRVLILGLGLLLAGLALSYLL